MQGVSSIISAVTLIVIAVALGAIIATWQSGFVQSFTNSLQQTVKLEMQCQHALLSIDNASYTCNNLCYPNVDHTLDLAVTNRGNLPLTITYAYLKNTTGGLFEYPFFRKIGVGQTILLTNMSREPCYGINKTIDEIVLFTHCLDTTVELPGELVTWIKC
jgi:hypothetical protein